MFKSLGKAFGKRKKRGRTEKPKPKPGEGLLQVAAVIPNEHDTPAPAKPARPQKQASPDDTRQAEPPKASEQAPQREPKSRERLIDEALRIRREKAESLRDLSPRDQEKLAKLARKMLLGEDEEAVTGEKPSPSGTPARKKPTRH